MAVDLKKIVTGAYTVTNTKAGAVIGMTIGGPVGMVVGAGLGAASGLVMTKLLTDSLDAASRTDKSSS